MNRKSFKLFVTPVTWLQNKVRLDPFFAARVKIFTFYFIFGFLILIFKGLATDYLLHGNLYKVALVQDGQPVRDAFKLATEYLWIESVVFLSIFGIAVFFITDFVLLPIKKASEIQKNFVSIVSHELRTPLTVMKNAIEVALRNPDEWSKEKTILLLQSSLEEIDRMSNTIQFLFVFTVLKERRKALSLERLSLSALVQETILFAQKQYAANGVRISSNTSESGFIQADRAAMKSLLFNLIENAILHTPRGGNVVASVVQQEGMVVLVVTDTGSGIRPEDIPYIFQPFYRGKSKTFVSEPHDRMGLGLSLVKEIVELHNAKVEVFSILGEGTSFKLTFPI